MVRQEGGAGGDVGGDAGGAGEALESTLRRQFDEPEHQIGSFPTCWPAHPCDQQHEVGSNSFQGDLLNMRQGIQVKSFAS